MVKENQEIVTISCKTCGKPTTCKKHLLVLFKDKHKKNCDDCVLKILSETTIKRHSKLTKEERSKKAKLAANKARENGKGPSKENIIKSWATIKANPIKFKELKKKRSVNAKRTWEELSLEGKKKVINALMGGMNNRRSKLSERFKQVLINENLYNGFESEQHFNGYFPDEINHKLKIIIEVYGEYYHCDPRKYTNPNQYIKSLGRTVGEQWGKDEKRVKYLKSFGYAVIEVWERDIRNNLKRQIGRIKMVINNKLKKLNVGQFPRYFIGGGGNGNSPSMLLQLPALEPATIIKKEKKEK